MCDISYILKIKPCMAAYSLESRTGQRESRDELSHYIVLLMLKSFVTYSFFPHGEKWMRDKRTPKDVCGEATEIGATDSQSNWRILLKWWWW